MGFREVPGRLIGGGECSQLLCMLRAQRGKKGMTKSDLIEKVAAQLSLPKGKAELIINCIFDSMEEALKGGTESRSVGSGASRFDATRRTKDGTRALAIR